MKCVEFQERFIDGVGVWGIGDLDDGVGCFIQGIWIVFFRVCVEVFVD